MPAVDYRDKWVKGLSDAQRTFRSLPDKMQKALNTAVADTATHTLAEAKRRVRPHRRYGFLEANLGMSMNEKTGTAKVGLPPRLAFVIPGGVAPSTKLAVTQRIKRTDMAGKKRKATFVVLGSGSAKGAQAIRPSKYAHLVEFGHKRGGGHGSAPAYPFMIPAAESQREPMVRRCTDQIRALERELERGHAQTPQTNTVGSRFL